MGVRAWLQTNPDALVLLVLEHENNVNDIICRMYEALLC